MGDLWYLQRQSNTRAQFQLGSTIKHK